MRPVTRLALGLGCLGLLLVASTLAEPAESGAVMF